MIPLLTVPAFFFPAVAIEFISRRTQAQTNAVAMSSRVYFYFTLKVKKTIQSIKDVRQMTKDYLMVDNK